MEDLDLRILELIHKDFPLTPNPYRALAQKLGVDEGLVYQSVSRMFQEGTIRRIGPVVAGDRLGLKGALAAVACPPGKLEEVAKLVNAYQEVTHNYLRSDPQGKVPYNMWFTVSAHSEERLQEIMSEIERGTGLSVLRLATRRQFKLRMDLRLAGEPGID